MWDLLYWLSQTTQNFHFIFFSKNFLPLSSPLFSLPLTLPLTKLIPTKFCSSFFCISGRSVSLIDPSSSWFKVRTLKAKIGDQSCSEIGVGGFRSAWDHGGWVSSQRGWLQLSVGRVWSWGWYNENSGRHISDLAVSSYRGGGGGKLGWRRRGGGIATNLAESFNELCSNLDLHLIISGFGYDCGSRVSIFLRFVRFNSSSSMLKSRFEIVDSIEIRV